MRGAAALAVLLGLSAAACSSAVRAPDEPGICYHVVRDGEEVRFNVLAREQESIEFCAARLEEMRLNFMRFGAGTSEVTGAYQGQYVFVVREGVYFGQTLEGGRFFALARTGDGRLAIPGAIRYGPPSDTAPAPAD